MSKNTAIAAPGNMRFPGHHNSSEAAKPSEAVTIEDVASLTMRIGEEIWGKDTFKLMMSSLSHPGYIAPKDPHISDISSVMSKSRDESA